MDLPKISLDSVKSKLGFSSDDAGYGRRTNRGNGYDDYADDYGDYGDYGNGYSDDYSSDYDTGVDNGYDAPGSLYEPYNQVTTRATSSRRSTLSSPRLVNATDVRASTHLGSSASATGSTYSPSTSTATSSSYRRSSGSSSFRTLIDNTTPAPSSPADVSSRKERSESLSGLFGDATAAAPASTGLGASRTATATSSYDPYDAYSNSSVKVHTPSRTLEIIKPQAYGDVERVAKILRAGDVAIIALNGTPGDLSKRVLDFSFGVASALDATVDCVAPKVFVITTGAALSDAERMKLRGQGVM